MVRVKPSEVSKLSNRQLMLKVIRISIPMILVLACALRGELRAVMLVTIRSIKFVNN